jgi:hypothetical protein
MLNSSYIPQLGSPLIDTGTALAATYAVDHWHSKTTGQWLGHRPLRIHHWNSVRTGSSDATHCGRTLNVTLLILGRHNYRR